MRSPAEKKKILVFIDWFLPGDKAGGPVRSCANLIDHLGDEFDFSVVTRDTDYTETVPYTSVKAGEWNNSIPGARVFYIPSDRLNRREIARLLTETEYDHVYLNGIWSQPFTVWPLEFLKKHKPGIKVTLAVRGMLAPSALAIKPIRKKAFLAYAKVKGIFSDVTFHATTANEANEVRTVFGVKTKVLVAGNLPRKNERSQGAINSAREPKRPGEINLVCIARIAPEKNMLFSLEALQDVQSKAVMHFWGPTYDKNYYDACMHLANKLPPNVSAQFHGAIASHEIPETLSRYDVLFHPTLGENFGHIILESLQAGAPVLISDQTPWKNLPDYRAGWDLPLDNHEAFTKKIDEIAAMTNDEFELWSESARKYAGNYTGDEKLISLSRNLFS